MPPSSDAESPQVANLRCHSSLFVLVLFNGITWMLLGLAIVYAIAIGDRPRYYATAVAAPATPPSTLPINDVFVAAAEFGPHESGRLRMLLDQGHTPNQLDAGGLSPLWHAVQAARHLALDPGPLSDLALYAHLAVLVALALTCDFEAQVEWVAGLRSRRGFRVLELTQPPRLVVDVRE